MRDIQPQLPPYISKERTTCAAALLSLTDRKDFAQYASVIPKAYISQATDYFYLNPIEFTSAAKTNLRRKANTIPTPSDWAQFYIFIDNFAKLFELPTIVPLQTSDKPLASIPEPNIEESIDDQLLGPPLTPKSPSPGRIVTIPPKRKVPSRTAREILDIIAKGAVYAATSTPSIFTEVRRTASDILHGRTGFENISTRTPVKQVSQQQIVTMSQRPSASGSESESSATATQRSKTRDPSRPPSRHSQQSTRTQGHGSRERSRARDFERDDRSRRSDSRRYRSVDRYGTTPPPDWYATYMQQQADFIQSQADQNRQINTNTAALITALAAGQTAQTQQYGLKPLKPESIGYFEPQDRPDAEAAYDFIQCIDDACISNEPRRVRATLRQCMKGSVATRWVTSLNQRDRDCLLEDVDQWKRLLRRDFITPQTNLFSKMAAETFDWSQGRSPLEYVDAKLRLLRINNIEDEYQQMDMIHAGLDAVPEFQQAIAYGKRDLDRYRKAILQQTEQARRLYDKEKVRRTFQRHTPTSSGNRGQSYPSTYPRNTPPKSDNKWSTSLRKPTTKNDKPEKGKDKVPSTIVPRTKSRSPNCFLCGKPGHWKRNCPDKDKIKEAYFVTQGIPDEVLAYYEQAEESYFAAFDRVREYEESLEAFYATLGDIGETSDDDNASDQGYAITRKRSTDDWNGYFANAYFGDGPKPRKTTQPTTVTAGQCRTCNRTFESNTKLHDHLKVTEHGRRADQEERKVIQSTSKHKVIQSTSKHTDHNVIDSSSTVQHIDQISDYKFTEVRAAFEVDGKQHTTCADTGFGTSTVDRNFVRTVIERCQEVRYGKYDTALRVKGFGGGVETLSDWAEIGVYYRSRMGQWTYFRRRFMLAESLSCNLLVGTDILYAEGITIDTRNQCLIMRCHGNAEVSTIVRRRRKIKDMPIRLAESVTLPPLSHRPVAIRFQAVNLEQDYKFTPNSSLTSAVAIPHAIFSGDQKKIMVTNVTQYPVRLYRNRPIGTISSFDTPLVSHWGQASEEVNAYFGFTKVVTAVTAAASVLPTTTQPTRTSGDNLQRPTLMSLPESIMQEYQPVHPYPLPVGIVLPDPKDSTYMQVNINTKDDITPLEIKALRQVCKRHSKLFNDLPGLVREPESEWMQIPVTKDESTLRSRPPIRLSKRGQEATDKVFDQNRQLGRIVPVGAEGSPYALQVFVVYNDTTGKARPVVDMRPLNLLVPDDAYPIPLQDEIINRIVGHYWISVCDLISAYYQRMIRPEHRYRTAVTSHRGHEMYTTVPMGYKRAVQHQQKLMDKLFPSKTWRFISCYVDDIVIYSKTIDEHLQHLDEVMSVLEDVGMTLSAKKCFIGYHNVELLGKMVNRLGLTTLEARTEAISKIEPPTSLSELESFIGIMEWNRKSIPFFAQRTGPLQDLKTRLVKNGPKKGQERKKFSQNERFTMDDVQMKAFKDLKSALPAATCHFQPSRPLYIYVDSSKKWGRGVAIYQTHPDKEDTLLEALKAEPDEGKRTQVLAVHPVNPNDLAPIMFLSKKLTPAEEKYWPTDLEFSGLVWAVKKVQHLIEQVPHTVVFTDHKAIQDLSKLKKVKTSAPGRSNMRHQDWLNFLSQFWPSFTIRYKLGREMEVPDALSRLRQQVRADVGDADEAEPIDIDVAFVGLMTEMTKGFQKTLLDSYKEEKGLVEYLARLEEDDAGLRTSPLTTFGLAQDGLIYFQDQTRKTLRLYVPSKEQQQELMRMAHDTQSHHKLQRTYERLVEQYYWKNMAKSVREYVSHCPECLQKTTHRHRPYGKLQMIRASIAPRHTFTMDLITDLPPCRNSLYGDTLFDAILVIVDKTSKAPKLIPGKKTWGSLEWAMAYWQHVYPVWGFPTVIITNRDKRFTANL